MMLEHNSDSPFLRASGEVPYDAEKAGCEVMNPKAEWSITVSGKVCSMKDTPTIKKRKISQPLDQYIDLARANFPDLHLCEAEITALRLWTGPMYKRYTFLQSPPIPLRQPSFSLPCVGALCDDNPRP